MKRSDMGIVAGVGLLVLLGAFWFMVIAPKRQEASDLSTKVDELTSQVDQQEQLAATAEDAESDYNGNYRQLVVLGKAVPEEADTSSLLVQLQGIADDSHVSFDGIAISEGAGEAVAAPAPATPPPPVGGEPTTPPADGTTPPAEGSSDPAAPAAEATPAAATTPAVPTEAVAATVPLGATVGPAGLPVMPYTMAFAGGFFDVADFLEGVDGLVSSSSSNTGVKGRLLTVDGFSLQPLDPDDVDGDKSDPVLNASLAVTTYLTPSSQGLVAGASPTTPPATTPAATPTPASATTTTPSATTTPAPAP